MTTPEEGHVVVGAYTELAIGAAIAEGSLPTLITLQAMLKAKIEEIKASLTHVRARADQRDREWIGRASAAKGHTKAWLTRVNARITTLELERQETARAEQSVIRADKERRREERTKNAKTGRERIVRVFHDVVDADDLAKRLRDLTGELSTIQALCPIDCDVVVVGLTFAPGEKP